MSDVRTDESFPVRKTHGTSEEVFGPISVPVDPTEPEQPGRVERLGKRAGEMWNNRPDIMEIHFIYLPLYLPIALAAGALAIGTVDKTLNLHIAERMAHVHVDKKDNVVERNFENVVHQLGVQAVKAEKS